jgi:hypothetical protein
VGFFLFFEVPELRGFVVAGAGEPVAVGAEGDGGDPVFVAFEGELLLPFLVADFDFAIGAGGREPVAVGGPGEGPDGVVVAVEFGFFFSFGRVPQFAGLIGRSARERAVRREGEAVDCLIVSLERLHFFGAIDFPEDDRSIFAAGREAFFVLRERDRAAPALVLIEGGLGLLLVDVPDNHLAVVASGDQRLAIGGGSDGPDVGRMAFERAE